MEPGIMQTDIDNLAERLMDLRLDNPPSRAEGTAASLGAATGNGAEDANSPAPSVIRWASRLKDDEKRDAEVVMLVLSKVERKDVSKEDKTIPRLNVSWQKQGKGYAYAAVWDEALFPYVANRVRQKTKFYLQHKGEYLNIIGVEA
jgi:hypothetical protein